MTHIKLKDLPVENELSAQDMATTKGGYWNIMSALAAQTATTRRYTTSVYSMSRYTVNPYSTARYTVNPYSTNRYNLNSRPMFG